MELLDAGRMAVDELVAGQEQNARRLALYREIADGAVTLARNLGRLGAQFVSVTCKGTIMSKAATTRPLTDMQSAWVREFVLNGGKRTDAAIKAGYAKESAAQRGWELSNLPHVQEAVRVELRRTFTDLAAIAVDQARLMLLDPKTPSSARVDLIKTMLDRAGLGVPKAGEDDGTEERPLRELSLAKLEAIAVRATFRPAEEGPAPVDVVVDRLEPPIVQPTDDEAR